MGKKLNCSFRIVLGAATLLMAASFSTVLNASTEEAEQAVINTFNWTDYKAELEERKLTAIAIQGYWNNFSDRIPSLTPDETAWMNEEFKKSGEPLARLFSSEIFAIHQLNNHAENCRKDISNLIESQSTGSNTEMFFWTKVIRCYSSGDLLIYLKNANLSNGRADGEFKLQHMGMIHNRIVDSYLPSAMAETMGWTLEDN